MARLEVHHGPIFSLHDICDIVLSYRLEHNIPTNTILWAKEVMELHTGNHTQLCMLTKNNHALVHGGRLHLRLDQCFGDITYFMKTYREQIIGSPRIMSKIERYKDELSDSEFFDNSVIQPGNIVNWSKSDDEYFSFITE
jgi:hypothetical protein